MSTHTRHVGIFERFILPHSVGWNSGITSQKQRGVATPSRTWNYPSVHEDGDDLRYPRLCWFYRENYYDRMHLAEGGCRVIPQPKPSLSHTTRGHTGSISVVEISPYNVLRCTLFPTNILKMFQVFDFFGLEFFQDYRIFFLIKPSFRGLFVTVSPEPTIRKNFSRSRAE